MLSLVVGRAILNSMASSGSVSELIGSAVEQQSAVAGSAGQKGLAT